MANHMTSPLKSITLIFTIFSLVACVSTISSKQIQESLANPQEFQRLYGNESHEIRGERFQSGVWKGLSLKGWRFHNVVFDSTSFTQDTLTGCTFQGCTFKDVNMSRVVFKDCIFNDVVI